MKFAQDYLDNSTSGQAASGFNRRLYGQSFSEAIDGAPSRNQLAAGWMLADSMIRKGKIFSLTKIDGKEIEFKCYLDGNAWCCVGPDFEDLQSSDCFAFSDTREEAIKAFAALDQ